MSYRVVFLEPAGAWLTSPIERWDVMNSLCDMLAGEGLICFGVTNAPDLAELFTQCLADATARQAAEQRPVCGMVTWGLPCGQYQAHTVLLPVRRPARVVYGTLAQPWWVGPWNALEHLAGKLTGKFGRVPALKVVTADDGECGGR